MMKSILITSVLLAGTFMSALSAQERPQERDPFYSEGPRSLETSTVTDGEWGRDPFTRPFEGSATVQQPVAVRTPGKKLTGIIFNKDTRLAIIGGETVKENGIVGDQRLLSIRRNSVVLMNSNGNTNEIFLENFTVRK